MENDIYRVILVHRDRYLVRKDELIADGWEELAYTGTFGETTYRYRKQVRK